MLQYIWVSVIFIVNVSALPWIGPHETLAPTVTADWSPRPTDLAIGELDLELLFRRVVVGSNTCAWQGVNAQSANQAATCGLDSSCAWFTDISAVACCATSGNCLGGAGQVYTTCVTTTQTRSNFFVRTCSVGASCYKNTFTDGYSQWGCGTIAGLTAVYTYSGNSVSRYLTGGALAVMNGAVNTSPAPVQTTTNIIYSNPPQTTVVSTTQITINAPVTTPTTYQPAITPTVSGLTLPTSSTPTTPTTPTVVISSSPTSMSSSRTSQETSQTTSLVPVGLGSQTATIPQPTQTGDPGLSTGAKAGIGAGAGVLALALIAGILFFCHRRSKRSRASHSVFHAGSTVHQDAISTVPTAALAEKHSHPMTTTAAEVSGEDPEMTKHLQAGGYSPAPNHEPPGSPTTTAVSSLLSARNSRNFSPTPPIAAGSVFQDVHEMQGSRPPYLGWQSGPIHELESPEHVRYELPDHDIEDRR